jgi:hypothetical protein
LTGSLDRAYKPVSHLPVVEIRTITIALLASAVLGGQAIACDDHVASTDLQLSRGQLAQIQAGADQLVAECEHNAATLGTLCLPSNILARCLYAAEAGVPSKLCEQQGYR